MIYLKTPPYKKLVGKGVDRKYFLTEQTMYKNLF
jgi:hypothetical protein